MNLYWIAILVSGLFLAAYFLYGRFLAKHLGLSDALVTPASKINDGVDFIPTEKTFLLGQHFSAIAAAGPIVGPILAGIWFGWLPVLIWIVAGSIFFGTVHDFSTLVGSVRHRAGSIVEIVKQYVGHKAYVLFLLFVWFSLMYVITAFTDLTSQSFVDSELGGGVAASSILYLVIGLMMGAALRLRMPLGIATPLFLAAVVASIWFGRLMPVQVPAMFGLSPQQVWNVLLLAYCFMASIIPVSVLLQPRGYLGGFFLYATLLAGIIGIFLGGEKIQYPAVIGLSGPQGQPLFPLLFVTVACGACSGFHGIVSSGTTSKQIAKETDCRLVGYGGMLLEGLVATIALATVMVLAKGDLLTTASPDRIYSEGLSRFVQNFGIPRDFARSFTLLAFTTFIYDTLDVATRLARYILEELTGWKGSAGRVVCTLLCLVLPFLCISLKMTDAQGHLIPAWKTFWTLFGTSNQLLAALSLMTLSVWLAKTHRPWWPSAVPMVFMMIMTVWSLVLMIRPWILKLVSRHPAFDAVGAVALLLLVLASLIVREMFKSPCALSTRSA